MKTNFLNLIDDDKEHINNVLKEIEGKDKVILYFHGGLSSDNYMKTKLGPLLIETILNPKNLDNDDFKTHSVFMQYNASPFQGDYLKELVKKLANEVSWKMIAVFIAKKLNIPIPEDNELSFKELISPEGVNISALELLKNLNFDTTLFKTIDDEDVIIESSDPDEKHIEKNLHDILENDLSINKDELLKIEKELSNNFDQDSEKAAVLWIKSSLLIYRIVKRFVLGTDHGIYSTTIEELSRIKIANLIAVGDLAQAHYNMIYNHSEEIWKNENGIHFLSKLNELCKKRKKKEKVLLIDLISHSAGSIPICYLLDVLKLKDYPEIKINNILPIVPAVRLKLFENQIVTSKEKPFKMFRMFLLDDFSETEDKVIPFIYERSLLYFVSGVAELIESKGDMTILGMHRYIKDEKPYNKKRYNKKDYKDIYGDLKKCRDFLNTENRMVIVSLAENIESTNGTKVIQTKGASHEFTKLPNKSPELAKDLIYLLSEKGTSPSDVDSGEWQSIAENLNI
ncbi:MAG: hypothetical protein COA50_07590 [Flavobacteriaceae bacterium]|nr:MAG: hypothetical protein COA50_07590 [Flavobacteriaceae bacterium]